MTDHIRMRDRNFALLGHDCPLGQYPSLAVPVGVLEGDLVAVYAGEEGTQFQPVNPDANFTRHRSATADMLQGFNPLKHGLFAFNEAEIVMYETGKEGEFYSRLLQSAAASSIEPFYRLSLSLETGQLSLIRPLFLTCARRMERKGGEFTDVWIKSVQRLSPLIHELRSEVLHQLRAPRHEQRYAVAAHLGTTLPEVVTVVEFGVSREDAELVAGALSQLVSQELNPRILSGDAYRSAIRASLALSERDSFSIFPQDAGQVPSPGDVARLSRLSLPLLEFHKIILSRAVINNLVEHSIPGRLPKPFLREILRPKIYEMHFRRPPIRIRSRQVFTYGEVLSLVGYSGPIGRPSWL